MYILKGSQIKINTAFSVQMDDKIRGNVAYLDIDNKRTSHI